jgi:hypothetical protein
MAKPIYSLAKLLCFLYLLTKLLSLYDKTFIFSWLNSYISAKTFYFQTQYYLSTKPFYFLAKFYLLAKSLYLLTKPRFNTFHQNFYLILAKPLYVNKTNIFTWLNFHLSTIFLNFFTKLLFLGKINIFYWLKF